MLNVVWFRRDLRVDDHAPLVQAVARGGIVLPLYIIEPGYWTRPVASARQWRFVARALAALRAQLAVLGAPLVVRTGDAVEVLEAIRAGARGLALWSHPEADDGWCGARDKRVAEWAQAQGVAWQQPAAGDIVRHGASNEDPARLWAERMAEAALAPPQAMMAHGLPPGRIVSESAIGLAADSCAEQPAGPQPARRLLGAFLAERAGRYIAERRVPGLAPEACSRLSPHLAWGTISAREVAQVALAARDGARPGATRGGIESFLWRLRLRARLMQRLEDDPSVEDRCIDAAAGTRAEDGADRRARLEAWAAGRTGFPLVDAGMRALDATGWLDCRMRALCASVAAHQLWLDWRAFGPVLARLVTDFEPGVHWAHCRRLSGAAGTPARTVDPVLEGARLDPEGGFIRRWVPELARVPAPLIHRPWTMSSLEQAETGCRIGLDYPAPLVPDRGAGGGPGRSKAGSA